MAGGASDADSFDVQAKWRALMDLSLARSDLALAEECARAGKDLSSLLLIYSSTGNAAGMAALVEAAKAEGRGNIAFVGSMLQGKTEEAANLLVDSGRFAEAAFFARTYAPSLVESILPAWKADAAKHSKRASEALALPPSVRPATEALCPDWAVALQAEVRRGWREGGTMP